MNCQVVITLALIGLSSLLICEAGEYILVESDTVSGKIDVASKADDASDVLRGRGNNGHGGGHHNGGHGGGHNGGGGHHGGGGGGHHGGGHNNGGHGGGHNNGGHGGGGHWGGHGYVVAYPDDTGRFGNYVLVE